MDGVVVISGGGTGIGAAIAHAVAEDGAHAVILGRREQVLHETVASIEAASGSGTASWLQADLSDPDQVERVAAQIGKTHGTIAGIVNNAGGSASAPGSTLRDLQADWHATYDQNVLTAVMLTTALVPILRRPGGRIVSVSSITAKFGAGGTAYAAAKGALNAWTLTLTYQYGKEGITANAVLPGYTPDTEFFGRGLPSARHESILARYPLGRAGTPADVAGVVRFLLSPDASFVTSQLIDVTGGVLPPGY